MSKIRFFSDIAVKPSAEQPISSSRELKRFLEAHVSGSNISGEVDVLDDGKSSIAFPTDIELIIVDNEAVKDSVNKILTAQEGSSKLPPVFVSGLPRNPRGEDDQY